MVGPYAFKFEGAAFAAFWISLHDLMKDEAATCSHALRWKGNFLI